jgi:hypothetical protein
MTGSDSMVLNRQLHEHPEFHGIVTGASATEIREPVAKTAPLPSEDTSTAAGTAAYYKRLNGD